MVISDLTPVPHQLPRVEGAFDGAHDILLVRVDADSSYLGWGEVVPSWTVVRATIEAPRAGGGRHGLRELARGLDPLDPPAVCDAMSEDTARYGRRPVTIHARAAGVDMAVWELRTQVLGLLLHGVLGVLGVTPISAPGDIQFCAPEGSTGAAAAGPLRVDSPIRSECVKLTGEQVMVERARRASQYHGIMRSDWRERLGLDHMLWVQVNGKVVEIIGMDRIGRAVWRPARGFGMTVLCINPWRIPLYAEGDATFSQDLPAMLPPCDFLFLHSPGGRPPPLSSIGTHWPCSSRER